MQTAGIAIQKGVPFSVYGENLIIMCQNFVIILLIWMYNQKIGFAEKLAVILFFAGYAYVLYTPGILTTDMLEAVSGSTILLSKYELKLIEFSHLRKNSSNLYNLLREEYWSTRLFHRFLTDSWRCCQNCHRVR